MKRFRQMGDKYFLDEQSGEIMLEATIIIYFVIIIQLVMIAMGFIIYELCVMNTIAVEEAENVARNYKFMCSDKPVEIDSKNANTENYLEAKMYRNSFSKAKYVEKCVGELKKVVEDRIMLSTLGMTNDIGEPKCEIITDNYGRMHVEVTLSVEFSTIFSELLDSNGKNGKIEYTTTGYAEIHDLVSHNSLVGCASYFADRVDSNMSNSKSIINSVNRVINSARNIFGF